jgi:REP element-mobilizing transposase RayT
MARAVRHYIPGYVWHITHRCHKREFLFKFQKDRNTWLKWLFQAKKRYGLKVLNYTVTSNHIHLLVHDDNNQNIIPSAIKLAAGCTGQSYNKRKNRKGSFWEDRYHATAVQHDQHLVQCMLYIDLNMVRAGVVNHPKEWSANGYNEIMQPKDRYSIIDHQALKRFLMIDNGEELRQTYKGWVDTALAENNNEWSGKWTESIAVGEKSFVQKVKDLLGYRVRSRKVHENDVSCQLKEPAVHYGLNDENLENSYLWETRYS